ncbi:MAG: hypothetical protein K6A72_11190 [Lachnospiraceae bacterium]|nr:hypothetical protein [Lachnospiraceae bacterium]
MSKVFGWLDRRKDESIQTFDNRINHLAAFHSGYAFFMYENYSSDLSAFSVYVVWNGEFNKKLSQRLPDGGFMLHCDQERAVSFLNKGEGMPVYVKLQASKGRLRAILFAVENDGALFDMYYNGCPVRRPENICFVSHKNVVVDASDYDEYNGRGVSFNASYSPALYKFGKYSPVSTADGSYMAGSYNTGFFGMGSYISGSFSSGSYNISSFMQGSYSYGSYTAGSYSFAAFMIGSYTTGSYSFGSYVFSHNWEWEYALGSYSTYKWTAGSYFTGSFLGGQYRLEQFLQGSYRLVGGSYNFWGFGNFFAGSFNIGSYSWLFGSFGMSAGLALTGSFVGGSYRAQMYRLSGSYSGGSYSGEYRLSGSFQSGSYVRGSFSRGFAGGSYCGYEATEGGQLFGNDNKQGNCFINDSNAALCNGSRPAKSRLSFIPKAGLEPSFRLIAEMGYGLDLI